MFKLIILIVLAFTTLINCDTPNQDFKISKWEQEMCAIKGGEYCKNQRQENKIINSLIGKPNPKILEVMEQGKLVFDSMEEFLNQHPLFKVMIPKYLNLLSSTNQLGKSKKISSSTQPTFPIIKFIDSWIREMRDLDMDLTNQQSQMDLVLGVDLLDRLNNLFDSDEYEIKSFYQPESKVDKSIVPETKVEEVAPAAVPESKVQEVIPAVLPENKVAEIAPVVAPETKVEEVAPAVVPENKVTEVAPVVAPETKVEEVVPVVAPETKVEEVAPVIEAPVVAPVIVPETKVEEVAPIVDQVTNVAPVVEEAKVEEQVSPAIVP